MEITKPSITRLARKAGVKSISDDSYDLIRDITINNIKDIITSTYIVNTENNTKTIMLEDIYNALELSGYNVANSLSLNTRTCYK